MWNAKYVNTTVKCIKTTKITHFIKKVKSALKFRFNIRIKF